jgi:transketolase
MVSVAAGLSRVGKIPVVATFGAFLTRAADQIRMARVSEANIKFIGSHVGVSIGEDGPSQMALEDIAMFGAIPDTVILQPADAYCAAQLVPLMLSHHGFVYMRTLRPKTPLLYDEDKTFQIGGSAIVQESGRDEITVAATGITVFEALKAAAELKQETDTDIRVVDCYSILPIDTVTLTKCLNETAKPVLITVEDHFSHGGLGNIIASSFPGYNIIQIAVTHISQSGTKDELLKDAGIDASSIKQMIKELLK